MQTAATPAGYAATSHGVRRATATTAGPRSRPRRPRHRGGRAGPAREPRRSCRSTTASARAARSRTAAISASVGRGARDDLVDPTEPRPQRGGEAGHDRRRGVGRGEVGRAGHHGEDGGIRGQGRGQPPRVVADERQRALRQLARRAPRAPRPPTMPRSGGGAGRGEPAAQGVDPGRGRGIRHGSMRPSAAPASSAASIRPCASRSGPQSSRSTPARIAARIAAACASPCAMARHVERVADGHALEPERPAEQARHDGRRQRGGHRVAVVQRGHGHVAGHHHRRAGVDRRAERRQVDGLEPRRATRGRSRSPWCVSASVSPRPGKCLTAAATPARLQPVEERDPERRDAGRVVAERADPDARRSPGRSRRRGPGHRPRSRPWPAPRGRSPRRRVPRGPGRRSRRWPCCPANWVGPSPRAWSWPPSWSAATSRGRRRVRRGRPPGTPRRARGPAPGERTFRCRNTVIPAAGAAASRSATQPGRRSPSKRP